MDERIRRFYVGMWVVSVVISGGGTVASAGPDDVVGWPCDPSERASHDRIDHSAFDALLQRYVDARGMVDYARWKGTLADLHALEAYLTRLGCVDLRAPARREARIAYWINAYNALTIHGILREYPTSSIRDHTARFGGYNIGKDLKLVVDGRPHALDHIEHSILRKMGEPRIHLALVCTSRGCPPLASRAYTAAGLDAQLTANGRRYLGDARNFRADPGTSTVYLSKLFQWFGEDFGRTAAEQLAAIKSMLPPGAEWVAGGAIRVRSLDDDWSLNDQRPASR